MKVMPIRYSADVEAMTRFYEALGLGTGPVSRPGGWVEMPAAAWDAGRTPVLRRRRWPL